MFERKCDASVSAEKVESAVKPADDTLMTPHRGNPVRFPAQNKDPGLHIGVSAPVSAAQLGEQMPSVHP